VGTAFALVLGVLVEDQRRGDGAGESVRQDGHLLAIVSALAPLVRGCVVGEQMTAPEVCATNARNAANNERMNAACKAVDGRGEEGKGVPGEAALRSPSKPPRATKAGAGGAGSTPQRYAPLAGTPKRYAGYGGRGAGGEYRASPDARAVPKRKVVRFAPAEFSAVNPAPRSVLACELRRPFSWVEQWAYASGAGAGAGGSIEGAEGAVRPAAVLSACTRDLTEKGCLSLVLATAVGAARGLRAALEEADRAAGSEIPCFTPRPSGGEGEGSAGRALGPVVGPLVALLTVLGRAPTAAAWHAGTAGAHGVTGGGGGMEGRWTELRAAARFYASELGQAAHGPLPLAGRLAELLSSSLRFHMRRALNNHMYDGYEGEGEGHQPDNPHATPPPPGFRGGHGRASGEGCAPLADAVRPSHAPSRRRESSLASAVPWAPPCAGGMGRGGGGVRGGFLALVPEARGSLIFNTDELAAVTHRALHALYHGRAAAAAVVAPHVLGALPDDARTSPCTSLEEGSGELRMGDLGVGGAESGALLTVQQLVDAAPVPALAAAADFASAHAFLRTLFGHEAAMTAVQADGDAWRALRMFGRIVEEFECEGVVHLAPLSRIPALLATLQAEGAGVDAMHAYVGQTLDRHVRALEVERRRGGKGGRARREEEERAREAEAASGSTEEAPTEGARPRKRTHTASRLASPANKKMYRELMWESGEGGEDVTMDLEDVQPTVLLAFLSAAAEGGEGGVHAGEPDLLSPNQADSALASLTSSSGLIPPEELSLSHATRVASLLEHAPLLLPRTDRFRYPCIRHCTADEGGRTVLSEGPILAPTGGQGTLGLGPHAGPPPLTFTLGIGGGGGRGAEAAPPRAVVQPFTLAALVPVAAPPPRPAGAVAVLLNSVMSAMPSAAGAGAVGYGAVMLGLPRCPLDAPSGGSLFGGSGLGAFSASALGGSSLFGAQSAAGGASASQQRALSALVSPPAHIKRPFSG